MGKYRIGDQVYANLGTLPVVGTVIDFHSGLGKQKRQFVSGRNLPV